MVILHKEKAGVISLSSLDTFNVFITEKWNFIICLDLFH